MKNNLLNPESHALAIIDNAVLRGGDAGFLQDAREYVNARFRSGRNLRAAEQAKIQDVQRILNSWAN